MYLRAARFIAFVALLVQPATAWAQSETVEYYGLDAIGSVRIVFDPSGNVTARLDYAPFGREVSSTGSAPDRKFASLFRDGEAGLDHAGARSYQLRTGRFGTVDPIYNGLFEPQRWNRYAYALNNPTVHVDPEGLQAREDGCSFYLCRPPQWDIVGGDGQFMPRGQIRVSGHSWMARAGHPGHSHDDGCVREEAIETSHRRQTGAGEPSSAGQLGRGPRLARAAGPHYPMRRLHPGPRWFGGRSTTNSDVLLAT